MPEKAELNKKFNIFEKISTENVRGNHKIKYFQKRYVKGKVEVNVRNQQPKCP